MRYMRRNMIAGLLLVATGALADTSVTVEVLDVTSSEGHMVLTVFEGKNNWLKRGYKVEKVLIESTGTVLITVELPPGEYAFHAYQDLDDNGKMKSNFIGIPKEPTAVSNNAKGKFGPPKYKDAKVVVGEEPVTVPMNLTVID